jgi:tetratricopeptide (TPR) repeat protein
MRSAQERDGATVADGDAESVALRPLTSEPALAPPPLSPPAAAEPTGTTLRDALHGSIVELTALVEDAEAAIASGDHADAAAVLRDREPELRRFPELAFRAQLAEAWARMYLGQLDASLELLTRARSLAERPGFTDVNRADVLFRLGACRLKLSSVANATSLFTVALELCDRSGLPCDRLRARILEWRSRCHQRHRDWDAAQADIECALELAEGIGDEQIAAHVHFQASLVAERTGQALMARFYAEEARSRYERTGDRLSLARILNNLGGLNFLLGDAAKAVEFLGSAAALAAELGSDADAAQATSSLAQVYLRSGAPGEAETAARQALAILEDRVDYLDEVGNVQLVLGRSLLEQERFDEAHTIFAAAEASFDGLQSVSHRAAAWVAQGDLARRRGDLDTAADLYRRSAEALQDFHF